MWYGVIFVRPWNPLYTVKFVTFICVIPVTGEHIYFSDETKEHKIIPFQWRGCITKCQKHSTKICERYCEQCNIPGCEQCASCLEHKGHDFVDVMKKIENIKIVIQKDLQELDKNIRPKYREIAL